MGRPWSGARREGDGRLSGNSWRTLQEPLDNPLIPNCLWGSQSWLPPASAGVPRPAGFCRQRRSRKGPPDAFQEPLDNPLILSCLVGQASACQPRLSADVRTLLCLVESEVGHSIARSETIGFCRLFSSGDGPKPMKNVAHALIRAAPRRVSALLRADPKAGCFSRVSSCRPAELLPPETFQPDRPPLVSTLSRRPPRAGGPFLPGSFLNQAVGCCLSEQLPKRTSGQIGSA